MPGITALGEPKAGDSPSAPPALRRPDRFASLEADLGSTVSGPWNRIACEAARRYCETRGAWARSFLILGAEGCGKSHLLSAIARGLRDLPGRRLAVTHIGCDDFVRQFTYAATHGKMTAFRQKFRSGEVLLVDDVDRLSGRPASQEEFVHIFDHLESAGRSVAMTTRVRPREVPGLSRPLQTRLGAAMQVRLDPPDDAGRRSILQAAAVRDRRTLPADVLEAAARPAGSTRDLVDRYARLRELSTLTAGAAAQIAGAACTNGPSLEAIARAVGEHFGLKLSEISGKGRSRRVTTPRHVCFHLAKLLTEHSLQEIAHFFGGRNHATVLYACRRISEADGALKGQVTRLEKQLAVNGASAVQH